MFFVVPVLVWGTTSNADAVGLPSEADNARGDPHGCPSHFNKVKFLNNGAMHEDEDGEDAAYNLGNLQAEVCVFESSQSHIACRAGTCMTEPRSFCAAPTDQTKSGPNTAAAISPTASNICSGASSLYAGICFPVPDCSSPSL